jgi:hypothetical protein
LNPRTPRTHSRAALPPPKAKKKTEPNQCDIQTETESVLLRHGRRRLRQAETRNGTGTVGLYAPTVVLCLHDSHLSMMTLCVASQDGPETDWPPRLTASIIQVCSTLLVLRCPSAERTADHWREPRVKLDGTGLRGQMERIVDRHVRCEWHVRAHQPPSVLSRCAAHGRRGAREGSAQKTTIGRWHVTKVQRQVLHLTSSRLTRPPACSLGCHAASAVRPT